MQNSSDLTQKISPKHDQRGAAMWVMAWRRRYDRSIGSRPRSMIDLDVDTPRDATKRFRPEDQPKTKRKLEGNTVPPHCLPVCGG